MAIAVRAARQKPTFNLVRQSIPRIGVRCGMAFLGLVFMACGASLLAAQSQQVSAIQEVSSAQNDAQSGASPATQQPGAPTSGVISGTVTDKAGDLAIGAKVALTMDGQAPREMISGNNGEYSFTDVPAGRFHLKVTAPGFDAQQYSGEIKTGQALLVPPIMLPVTGAVTDVKVGGTPEEIAQVEVKQELQQRVLGIFPNFYVAYSEDPAPLFAKQKFNLAWKSVQDPVTILGVAFLAGIYQAADIPGGYGQGAEGYGRRFGGAYGDVVFGTFIGSAILPSVLHQDPRYFYLGPDHSNKERWKHALANAVVARNDRTKKWEPNYSGLLGSFAAGAISYAYTPASDRSTGMYLEDSLVRVGESGVAGILQEFVLRKFTSHVPKQSAVSGP